jgi:ATP-dependent RNA helicase SUPV3L1/SUV3
MNGRHMRDGSFGVPADCAAFDEATVASIEEHQFEPQRALQWRSEILDFSSLHALTHSLKNPLKAIRQLFAPSIPGSMTI